MYLEGARLSPQLPTGREMRQYRTSFKSIYKEERAHIAGELNKLPTMGKRLSIIK